MSEQFESIARDPVFLNEIARKLPVILADPAYRQLLAGRDIAALLKDSGGLESAARLDGMLEKVIRLVGRPALLITGGTYAKAVMALWTQALEAARGPLERAIASVGRIEIRNQSDGVGTAWMIANGVVVTNAHVARLFAYESPAGSGKYRFRKDFSGKSLKVYVDFREEYLTEDELECEVEEVVYIAPDDPSAEQADVALMRLKARPDLPRPIPLAPASDPPIGDKVKVAIIGYPHYDHAEDPKVRREIFGDIYAVKRLGPGETMASDPSRWYFRHDASSLGGNSGSVVIELARGVAVGLHFSGTSLIANYAVRVSALRAILAKLNLAAAAPPKVVVSGPAPGTDERSVPVGVLNGRNGYDPDFLGIPVAHPAVRDPSVIAERTDGKGRAPLAYRHFSLQVHGLYKQPIWTAVNIEGTSLKSPTRPGTSAWAKDTRLDPDQQIGHEFYTNSGFSRGHIVRRVDPAWGSDTEADEGNLDTFHFTNCCPQDQEFNDKFWGDLEDEVRRDATGQKITVLTGPIFSADAYYYENEGVEALVPNRFWKLIVLKRGTRLAASAYVLDQAPYLEDPKSGARWAVYQVPITDLQDEIGIDFDAAVVAADATNVLESVIRKRLLRDASEALFFAPGLADESEPTDAVRDASV